MLACMPIAASNGELAAGEREATLEGAGVAGDAAALAAPEASSFPPSTAASAAERRHPCYAREAADNEHRAGERREIR